MSTRYWIDWVCPYPDCQYEHHWRWPDHDTFEGDITMVCDGCDTETVMYLRQKDDGRWKATLGNQKVHSKELEELRAQNKALLEKIAELQRKNNPKKYRRNKEISHVLDVFLQFPDQELKAADVLQWFRDNDFPVYKRSDTISKCLAQLHREGKLFRRQEGIQVWYCIAREAE